MASNFPAVIASTVPFWSGVAQERRRGDQLQRFHAGNARAGDQCPSRSAIRAIQQMNVSHLLLSVSHVTRHATQDCAHQNPARCMQYWHKSRACLPSSKQIMTHRRGAGKLGSTEHHKSSISCFAGSLLHHYSGNSGQHINKKMRSFSSGRESSVLWGMQEEIHLDDEYICLNEESHSLGSSGSEVQDMRAALESAAFCNMRTVGNYTSEVETDGMQTDWRREPTVRCDLPL